MPIQFKPEVRIVELTAAIADVLVLAGRWSLRANVGVEVNSIDDGAGVHQAGSLHGSSLAIDLDTVGDRPADLEALAEWLRRTLPAGYDLVYEGDHVHVEWDPHRPKPFRSITT
ncbi:MAG: hypothetical protein LC750_16680 [Actinobacteria bacterium]|nr:hypothetical protein [Actinomycetota bacterium]